ncbi:MAG: 30S ribosomal protein S2 [Lentisphaeraceae bacterium]|nr:30S ribosomal protein S2 [Lentisphaeraceae bacterium]
MAITVQDLLEAGVHFGHQTKRWNPKMKPYIFGSRNGIHIFDLGKTMYCLNEACKFLYKSVAQGGDILYVGTKRQAQELVTESAQRDNMHYITHRWLGGTLTNLDTIRKSIAKLGKLQKMEEDGSFDKMKKKESSRLRREMNKLDRALCGIINMKKKPAVMIVVDVVKERIAVKEANILGIPVVGLIDSNVNPDLVKYGIPGNDDAVRSLKVILDQLSTAIHAGKGIADKKAAEVAAKRAQEEEEKRAAKKAKAEKAKEDADKAKANADKAKAEKAAPKKDDAKAAPKKEEAKAEKAPAKKAPAKKAAPKKDDAKAEEPKAEKAPAKKAPAKKAAPKKDDAKAEEPKAEKAPAKKAPAKKAAPKKDDAKAEETKAEEK